MISGHEPAGVFANFDGKEPAAHALQVTAAKHGLQRHRAQTYDQPWLGFLNVFQSAGPATLDFNPGGGSVFWWAAVRDIIKAARAMAVRYALTKNSTRRTGERLSRVFIFIPPRGFGQEVDLTPFGQSGFHAPSYDTGGLVKRAPRAAKPRKRLSAVFCSPARGIAR